MKNKVIFIIGLLAICIILSIIGELLDEYVSGFINWSFITGSIWGVLVINVLKEESK